MDAIISIRNVTQNYGDREVLKKIKFDIYRSGHIGLIGRNSAGKPLLQIL